MNIRIISVPYDLGREFEGKGRAPDLFMQRGLDQRLRHAGHKISTERVRLDDTYFNSQGFPSETGAVFEINRMLAHRVRVAVQAGQWPLVLAGNCNSCVGTLAGLASANLGIAWFDAHGDFNTPETTTSGYIDGMGLAMAAGRCWQGMLSTLEGFKYVPENCIVHLGARDLDSGERAMMNEAGIALAVAPAEGNTHNLDSLASALDRLPGQVDGLYLHLDMDVLMPPGLSPATVSAAVQLIKQRYMIAGCGVASYDPGMDPDYQILLSGIDLILDMVAF